MTTLLVAILLTAVSVVRLWFAFDDHKSRLRDLNLKYDTGAKLCARLDDDFQPIQGARI